MQTNTPYDLLLKKNSDYIYTITYEMHKITILISRLWTWMHPGGTTNQLDHILINSKWTNSIRNCRAYNSVNWTLITASSAYG